LRKAAIAAIRINNNNNNNKSILAVACITMIPLCKMQIVPIAAKQRSGSYALPTLVRVFSAI
jgi:uncharacterized membrane protein YadS